MSTPTTLHVFAVGVHAPQGTNPEQLARVLDKLIKAGIEDASASLEDRETRSNMPPDIIEAAELALASEWCEPLLQGLSPSDEPQAEGSTLTPGM